MLLTLLGNRKLKKLYNTFYDATLENIRLIGKNWYAPSLDVYDDYEEEEARELTTMRISDTGEGQIGKAGASHGDDDRINFENATQDRYNIATSGNLVLRLLSTENYDQIIADISVIINYGICKLETKLLGVMREIYEDMLIGNKYQVIIKTVNISMGSSEIANPEFGVLNVSYNINIVDERAIRPPTKEEESDEEAGGREYKRIRDETQLRTKKKEKSKK